MKNKICLVLLLISTSLLGIRHNKQTYEKGYRAVEQQKHAFLFFRWCCARKQKKSIETKNIQETSPLLAGLKKREPSMFQKFLNCCCMPCAEVE